MAKQEAKTPAKSEKAGQVAHYRWPGDIFSEMQERMNRMFDDVWRGRPTLGIEGFPDTTPKVDVEEKDDAFLITAELPGMDEKDVEVTVSDDMLTIKGEKRESSEREEKNMHITERSYGSFRRSFRVPQDADAGKVQAHFEKGVLHIDLPKKAAKENPVKKIKIKTAK